MTPTHRAALAAALLASLAAMPACKPMKPRPAAAPQQQPAPAQAEAPAPRGDDPLDSKYRSTSTLGKARDAALRTRDKIDAYQQDVARQADEALKNP
jgi:hypothetical protein